MGDRKFRKVYTGDDMRDRMMCGIHKLAEIVGSTIGPFGHDVIINNLGQLPSVTNDGISVAQAFDCEDDVENLAVDLIRSVSAKTNEKCGDGTTTSIVLSDAMLEEASWVLRENPNVNVYDLKAGMNLAMADIDESLDGMVRNISTNEDIFNVARISANNNDEIGRTIADAYQEIGLDGVLAIERVYSPSTHVEIQKGYRMDKGYIDPVFINDKLRNVCEYDEGSYVLMCPGRLDLTRDFYEGIAPLVTKDKRESLLIVCTDPDGAFTKMKQQNGLRMCIVTWKGSGDSLLENLEDLSVFADGKPAFQGCYLGYAKGFRSEHNKTTVFEGRGTREQVQERINVLRSRLDPKKPRFHDVLLNDRIGYLDGKIGIIHLGAKSLLERGELYDVYEDATKAVKSAIEGGIVPGASHAYLSLSKKLGDRKQFASRAHELGHGIVRKSLDKPFRLICGNAGIDHSEVLARLERPNAMYDVKRDRYLSLGECDIYEPRNVVRYAVSNAISVCSTIILANNLIY